jgi:hypothetical protein
MLKDIRRGASSAVLAGLGVAALFAAPAFGYGPNADTSESTTDPAVIACAGPGADYGAGAVANQTERGVQAGGGPKSVAVAPANCDHYWQDPAGAGVIGNGWPPPSQGGP